MTTPALHRHDISDRTWELLESHLPGRQGQWGGVAKDNRTFINAVLWILRTGAPWRDLPAEYGDWKNTHRRFCRWRDARIWEKRLEQLVNDVDYEWLMIDASHIKSIRMLRGPEEEIRTWRSPKGAQHQATSGRGCTWYADPSAGHNRHHGRLYTGGHTH